MKLLILILISMGTTQVFSNNFYNSFFTKERLRIDYYMYAEKDNIEVHIKDIVKESRWAGIKNKKLNHSFGGNFKYQLIEIKSGELIFEKGFSSLVEEWQSSELNEKRRKFEMVAVMPCPKNDVNYKILQWDMHKGKYTEVFSKVIIMSDIGMSKLNADLRSTRTQADYTTDSIVDVVILSEGYTKNEEEMFIADCKHFEEYVFSVSPFDEYKSKFRIKNVFLPSEESGTSMTDGHTKRKTNLESSFYTFGEPRYLTTESLFKVHDMLANIDYDCIIIVVNTDVYGGAGFYNTYAITSTRNPNSLEVFIHEFGHSFAGLADEYFYEHDDVLDAMYDINIEPWEANITSKVNFASKWEQLIKKGIEGVGLYEGAGYLTKGMYRGEDNCKMRELSKPFCTVCNQHIIDIINYNIGQGTF